MERLNRLATVAIIALASAGAGFLARGAPECYIGFSYFDQTVNALWYDDAGELHRMSVPVLHPDCMFSVFAGAEHGAINTEAHPNAEEITTRECRQLYVQFLYLTRTGKTGSVGGN